MNEVMKTHEAFRKGDAAAFEKLYEQYRDSLLRKIQTIVRNPESAEELLQETFIKIHRFRESFHSERSFAAWAQTLAQNTAVDWLRVHGRTFAQPQNLIEEIQCKKPNAEIALLKREIQAIFRHATRPLSALQKTVLLMRLGDHLSYSEIADKLDLTLDAVKSAMYRAKRSLMLIPEDYAYA